MEIAPTSGEKDRSVLSFLKIADLDRLGTRFLEATNWNEEAQQVCFSGAGVGGHDLPSSSSSLVVSMTGWGESAGVDDDRDLMLLGDTDDDHIASLPARREVPYKSADKEEEDSMDATSDNSSGIDSLSYPPLPLMAQEFLSCTNEGPPERVSACSRKRHCEWESDTGGRKKGKLSSASGDAEIDMEDDPVEILCQELEYLDHHLPEEPKDTGGLVCRVAVRLPDSRRLQRSFLQSDTINLLWSFCSSQLDVDEARPFHFALAAPGSKKLLDYESGLTFKEAGVSDTLLSLLWD